MCGIAFVSDLNERTVKLIPWMGFSIRLRGGDSWGMTNGLETYRTLGPFTAHAAALPYDTSWYRRPLLVHTRAASVGAVSLENCHPFDITGDRARVIGIHNGGISNHDRLNKEFSRTYDCDSPHVFHHLADGIATREVNMRGVIVWLENDSPTIHLCRTTSGDLYVARLKTGEIIGASTASAVLGACEVANLEMDFSYATPKDEVHYTIAAGAPQGHPDGWQLYIGDPMPFGYGTYYPLQRPWTAASNPQATTHRHGNGQGSGQTSGSGTSTGTTGKESSGTCARNKPFGFIASGDRTPVQPPVFRAKFTICAYCNQPLDRSRPMVLCDECLVESIGRYVEETRRGAKETAPAKSLVIVATPGAVSASEELSLIKTVAEAQGVTIV